MARIVWECRGNHEAALCRILWLSPLNLQRRLSEICTSLTTCCQKITTLSINFAWQIEAGSRTEIIIKPDSSDDSEAQVPASQGNVTASSVGNTALTAKMMLGQHVAC